MGTSQGVIPIRTDVPYNDVILELAHPRENTNRYRIQEMLSMIYGPKCPCVKGGMAARVRSDACLEWAAAWVTTSPHNNEFFAYYFDDKDNFCRKHITESSFRLALDEALKSFLFHSCNAL